MDGFEIIAVLPYNTKLFSFSAYQSGKIIMLNSLKVSMF